MIIQQCMKRDVISIHEEDSIAQAARLLVQFHVGTLPVTDSGGRLTGLVQMRDLLSLVMPSFVNLVQDFDFVHDFGAIESGQPTAEKLAEAVGSIMHPPTSVEEDCGLLRAIAILQTNRLLDVPVVDKTGRLVGIASRVDIGSALLQSWQLV